MLEATLDRLDADSTLGKLEVLCDASMRARAHLLDVDELVSYSLARMADRSSEARQTPIAWAVERINLAIDDMLIAEEASPLPNFDQGRVGGTFETWMMSLGVEPEMIRRAARRFNILDESTRQAFFMVVIDEGVLEELHPPGTELSEELLIAVRTALKTILTYNDPDPACERTVESHAAEPQNGKDANQ